MNYKKVITLFLSLTLISSFPLFLSSCTLQNNLNNDISNKTDEIISVIERQSGKNSLYKNEDGSNLEEISLKNISKSEDYGKYIENNDGSKGIKVNFGTLDNSEYIETLSLDVYFNDDCSKDKEIVSKYYSIIDLDNSNGYLCSYSSSLEQDKYGKYFARFSLYIDGNDDDCNYYNNNVIQDKSNENDNNNKYKYYLNSNNCCLLKNNYEYKFINIENNDNDLSFIKDIKVSKIESNSRIILNTQN